MLQACVVSVYNQPVPESLERYEIVFLEANVGSDSTGILEPSVKSTTNSSLAQLCVTSYWWPWGEEKAALATKNLSLLMRQHELVSPNNKKGIYGYQTLIGAKHGARHPDGVE